MARGKIQGRTPYGRLRTGPREPRPPKIYDPDPAAVKRLKRILAEREGRQPDGQPDEPAGEKGNRMSGKQTNFKEAMTADRAAKWARSRREGKSYDWITKHDDLHPSYPTIKRYLKEYGYAPDGRPLERVSETSDGKAELAELPAEDSGSELATAVNGAGELEAQLDAIGRLLDSFEARDVQVSGRVTVQLEATIEI